ncbi:immunity 53 family protein [Chitinophaga sp. CF418]|uniref:immunity 53 family protein n=1 Tax=Chitinophaga sp. CF418 TaxID=1855287 RepID=UPI000922CBCB|nr:immunity 53 family protein [Chitinophaga sp. CF418]SHN25064.1 Immunity protein 53 [Chitinophaga sp. CF418]
MADILEWLIKWFDTNCDGEWERENQIQIHTVGNPGWYIKIDLRDTPLEDRIIDSGLIEQSDHDWYFYRIKDTEFQASGDNSKLIFLLSKFREIAEAKS